MLCPPHNKRLAAPLGVSECLRLANSNVCLQCETSRWNLISGAKPELRIAIAELRIAVPELRIAIAELRITIAELRIAIAELRIAVSELRIALPTADH